VSKLSTILNRPYSPFPSRTHWSLELNNAITARPAFDQAAGYFAIEGERIAAYDLTAGTLRWLVSAAPRSALAAGAGLLFVDQSDQLTALRGEDGSMAWSIPFADTLAVPLVVADGWLLACTNDAVFAYRASDGSLAWRREIAGVRAAPAVLGDRVFLSTADSRVLALRVADGEMVWGRKVGGQPNDILPLETQLFVGSTNNYLYCLNTVDGAIEWTKQTGADVIHRPVADADNVYFVSLDNVLRALNRGHGVQQWMRPLPFRPAWPPLIALDAVVVAGLSLPPRAYFLKTGAPAEALTTDKTGEIAAPLHAFSSPVALGPVIILVIRSTAVATVTATSRTIEPAPTLGITPLPTTTPGTTPQL
jgi:outer membrane protein assembly factor BamB